MIRDSLKGVRVLDFSHVLAGPVCSMTLADLGAHVVKIEPPGGEIGRQIGPPWVNGVSPAFMSVNRGKYSVAIDLKTDAGRRTVAEMARQADVVVENFRPGVMASMGLGYETLRTLNPQLVYCSISAFGQRGESTRRPGVDGVIQAVSGLMSTLGTTRGDPLKVPVPVADMMGGYLAAIAVLGALHAARTQRKGQHLDVSLYNATLMLQQIGFAAFFASGSEPEKVGSAAPYACPNEAFPTRDGWMMVVAYHAARWSALCELLDAPELEADTRFASNDARVRHRAELHEILAARFAKRTTAEWIELLSARDILCAPVTTYREVMETVEYRQSGIARTVEHPVAGSIRTHGFALGPSDPPAGAETPAPVTGQHTLDMLGLYGFDEDAIATLLNAGVIRAAAAHA
ncbi:CoA transferase [Caballeronia sp. LZ034LL]|uniref:CaiB/BaiF CoA transferase family protein n=1 Tax=Caballeronia sp. LZ034LL TaxID=3038567 RepID=UPI002864E845|nr:CoA transferase [Caballeronia sp. LZ034LL]MDR5837576.1 CoA transferase [Caballeronia sp. LZ034LL]